MAERLGSADSPADRFPVRVVLERRAVWGNRWVSESWRAVGVTLGHDPSLGSGVLIPIAEGDDRMQFLWQGLVLELFRDEAESYYHNLTVPEPACYIVCRSGADGSPAPFLVTLSFDAAQAYGEADETVFAVPLPAELYKAAEGYVLAHYVPERRRKRRLDDWKGEGRDHPGH